MLDDAGFAGQLRQSIESVRNLAPDAVLRMVANVKSAASPSIDYLETSVTTEHFTGTELGMLMDGFRQLGFFVAFHDGEIDFLRHELARYDNPANSLEIVYSTAQTGTGSGRKSLVPAFCALMGIRICNSEAYVLSLARQKFHVHCILKRLGLPTVDTWLFATEAGWVGGKPPVNCKLIAKAAFESASIGLTPNCVGMLDREYEDMLRAKCEMYRQPFVVQRLIDGFEAEVPLLDLDRMRAVEVVSVTLDGSAQLRDGVLYQHIIDDESYDYTKSEHLGSELRAQIGSLAERTASALNLRGIGRVDFRVSADGLPYITDVATSPHLVAHSSFAKCFSWHGFEHSDLLAAMIGANLRHWASV